MARITASLLPAISGNAPIELIRAAVTLGAVPQELLVANGAPLLLKSVRTGSGSTPETLIGAAPRVGPTARMRTVSPAPGPMTKPETITVLPVPTWPLVDILARPMVASAKLSVPMTAKRPIVVNSTRPAASKCLIRPAIVPGLIIAW